jgi:hypothetical protein
LHGSFGDLPLWLDEGLAEYFESDLARPDANRERIDHIATDLAAGWSPSLDRLETISDIREMSPRDYREAWSWVHLLLNGSADGKPRLLAALAELNENEGKLRLPDQGPTNDRLLAHLKTLQSRSIRAEVDAAAPSVRLQDRPVETPSDTTAGHGLLRRLRTLIGL